MSLYERHCIGRHCAHKYETCYGYTNRWACVCGFGGYCYIHGVYTPWRYQPVQWPIITCASKVPG